MTKSTAAPVEVTGSTGNTCSEAVTHDGSRASLNIDNTNINEAPAAVSVGSGAAGAISSECDNLMVAPPKLDAGRELVIVDSSVVDRDVLLQDLVRPASIVVLRPDRPAIAQIGEALAAAAPVSALHLIAHGEPGAVCFGAGAMTARSHEEQTALVSWQTSLAANAMILLYACRTAAGSVGQSFATRLSALTRAHVVAASQDLGGGADWRLDVKSDCEPSLIVGTAAQAGYLHRLATEVRVNTTTFDSQFVPSVAGLLDGGYVVTWQSISQDGSFGGIYQQRYDAAGAADGVERLVNTTTTDQQLAPSVTALADGGWIVTWQSFNQDASDYGIYQQRYNASGVADGIETRVNTTTTNEQADPSVAALADGGWVVTWESLNQDGSSHGVYQQRFDALGAADGIETLVNTTTFDRQLDASVAALADGGWVVTWEGPDGSFGGIYQQRYDAAGAPEGVETLVNTTTFNSQTKPSVAGLSDGGWVVTWTSRDGAGIDSNIYQQRYDAAGAPDGAEMLVDTTPSGKQLSPSVTGLGDGGWVVTWADGNGSDVHQQRYDAAGAPDGADMLVHTTAAGQQSSPSVAALAGGWVVAWQSEDGAGLGVYARSFAVNIISDGSGATAAVLVAENGTAVTTVVASDPDLGQPLTYSLAGGADEATFTIDSSTGALAFLTAPDFENPGDAGGNNVYDVIVQASDGTLSDMQALAVTITNVNDAPVAQEASGSGDEDQAVTGTLTGADVDGDPLTFKLVEGSATNGVVTIAAATGAYTFTPTADYNGPASFRYLVNDGALDSDAATVSLTVAAVNDVPVVEAVSATGAEDAPAGIPITLKASDIDGGNGGEFISFFISSLPSNGVLYTDATLSQVYVERNAINAPHGPIGEATLYFKPAADFHGEVTFNYIAYDGFGQSAATATVTVNPVNDTPVAQNQAYDVNEDQTVTGYSVDNGTIDVEQNSLTYTVVDGPTHGSLTMNASTGGFSYTPEANYNGPDSFTYKANDGTADSNVATVSLTIEGTNDAPTITSNGGEDTGTQSVAENTTAVRTVEASDPDGDAVSYLIAGGADADKFDLNATTGALTFAAAPDFEVPGDADGDNTYEVIVEASDGTAVDTQTLSVSITDEDEVINRPATGGVSISSYTTTNTTGTLTAASTINDPDVSTPAISYQWQASSDGSTWTNIAGAAAAVFTLTGAQVGPLLRVTGSYSDPFGTYTHVSSETAIVGNQNANTLNGTSDRDILLGLNGTDNLNGGDGEDRLDGGGGTDSLDGGLGADTMLGGAADDTYVVDNVLDVVTESAGNGTDTIRTTLSSYSIGANVENLTFIGTEDFTATGNSLSNRITGAAGNDTFLATQGDGRDTYDGSTGRDTYSLAATTAGATLNLENGSASSTQIGSDTLTSIENVIGSSGGDMITAGGGANSLTGGLEADQFVFRSTANAGTGSTRDQITDFTQGSDRISVSAIDANISQGGNQAFQFVGAGPITGPAQLGFHFLTIDGVEHTIIEGNVNANTTPEFQIDLIGRIQLTAGDFIL
jgi:VCBS repeat-containing protein